MAKIVLANGCFDLFHYGHLMHLEQAKTMGDKLVVSITDDAHVNKPGRPVYNHEQRAAIVKALRCVDEVVIVSGLMDALFRIQPDIVVKGSDYDKLDHVHAVYCKNFGIEVRFTNTPKLSATEFIDAASRR